MIEQDQLAVRSSQPVFNSTIFPSVSQVHKSLDLPIEKVIRKP